MKAFQRTGGPQLRFSLAGRRGGLRTLERKRERETNRQTKTPPWGKTRKLRNPNGREGRAQRTGPHPGERVSVLTPQLGTPAGRKRLVPRLPSAGRLQRCALSVKKLGTVPENFGSPGEAVSSHSLHGCKVNLYIKLSHSSLKSLKTKKLENQSSPTANYTVRENSKKKNFF